CVTPTPRAPTPAPWKPAPQPAAPRTHAASASKEASASAAPIAMHLLHVLDHGPDAELRRPAAGAGHAQRLEAQTGRGRERQHVGKVGVMIDMQEWVRKMSFTSPTGNCRATMLRMQPEPKSKKKRLPLPSSTMMQVPAWSRRGGHGALPTKEIRISSSPSSSAPG